MRKTVLKGKTESYARKNRDYKTELQVYEKCTHNLSLMLKPRTKKTGLKRYNKIIDEIDDVPEKVRGFIRNIQKWIICIYTLNMMIYPPLIIVLNYILA